MVEILGQLIKFKVLRDVQSPRLGHRLKRAQEHLACVFFIIRALVRDTQHRHLREARNRFGHDVEMLARMQRNVYARHATNAMTPHAATVDDMLRLDRACLAVLIFPRHTRYTTTLFVDIRDEIPFLNERPILARAFRQSMGDIRRIALTV